ncbi:sperm flagellar protein 2-like [Haliotis cracherodii]|uniref:sperm flagellar protein 2-like n=1 Tax=Haliotis cracherodii TaxID=6455 RepID=UPI0039E7B2C1
MTDILVNWLNEELAISSPVDQRGFSRQFSSGFLIGEVLNKYQLQDDFDQFSQSKTADSKLNNFTRIEPVLHLLGIPFDTNVARDIMTERHGVATRIMYQLYIALNNKKKANLTGVAMETMRPAAPAKLNAVETEIYKQRLKHATPRQTDLNLEALVSRFHEKQIEMEKTAFKERFVEQERILQEQQQQRQALLERSRQLKAKQSEMVAKIQAATVEIPKPPANRTSKAMQLRRNMKRRREAQEAMSSIAMFEEKMKTILPPSKLDSSESFDVAYLVSREDDKLHVDPIELIKPTSNDDYIGKIRKRLHEDSNARQEREKRRRKVLVDQMKSHESQEEARREEMMVNRLMRQSQQERRIAVQLLQARHEKEVIRTNRITREKQYEERRLRDFEDALDKEAELARLSKLEYMEQTKKDKELHDQIAAQRAADRYKKHYDICSDVVNQVVDFASKVAEYRELTNGLLPPKLMREWTAVFVAGQPLFEPSPVEGAELTPEQILEEERQQLLDEGDFMEYKNMIGEWQPPEGSEQTEPPKDNAVLGHIIHRLFNLVHPPSPPPPPPEFPPFPVRACILGKVFSGKTTCITKLAAEHRLQVLIVDELVDEAVEAHKAGETIQLPAEGEGEEKIEHTPTDQAALGAPGDPATVSATPLDNVPQEMPTPQPEGLQSAPSADVTAADKPTPSEESPDKPAEVPLSEPQADMAKPASKRSSSRSKEVGPPKPQPSNRAKLGSKALKYLKRGKPVDDQVIVDVLVEVIRRVPEGTGWVIDGFPQTYNQAKMLEKALTGFDATAKEQKEKPKDKAKPRKSSLVPDPRPAPPPPEPASGIDVVIQFELSDDLCMKRAAGRFYAVQADKQYHQEFNPPPEGSATGVGKEEKVIPIEDASHDQEQIQQRITGYHDSWPKLEKWFTRFGTLKKVDASEALETVFLEVEKVLEDTVSKIQGKDQESSAPIETETPVVEEKPPEPVPEPVPEPPKEEPVVETKGSRSSSKGSRSGSGKKSAGSRTSSKDKDKRDKSASPKRSPSPKKGDSKKGSRGSTPKSPKRGRSGKKGKVPEPEPEPEPEVPTGPPPPLPGSEEWEFVDQSLELDLAKVLASHWETVEKSYVLNSKHVFRNIRDERERIYRYFYQIRKDYMAYLRRPDHKQEFISQWQKEYNEVPDDMREDEETRAELHQTVDDLRERLWNICDERKEQAEGERETVMNDSWLDDRLGVLSNHYITLMQSEVDRYQDTVRMLKDYYRGMDGHIPDELNTHYARIPLIEMPVERPETPADKEHRSEPTPTPQEEPPKSPKDKTKSPRAKSPRDRSKSPKESRSKSPKDSGRSKSRTPSGKKRSKSLEKEKEKHVIPEATQVDGDGQRKRIPLVPRRPISPDPDAKPGTTPGKDKKDKKGGKKGGDDGVESPIPPSDLDEKLIFDAAQSGITAISHIMSLELAAREAEEEAERQREQEKEREREKEKAKTQVKKGGKKGGKSRSPSPKKKPEADVAPTPPPQTEEECEEERQKKLLRAKMREEYYFAIAQEERAAKVRLDLIKVLGIAILQDLKGKGDNAFKDMNDWLGARYLKEMESIDHLSETVRYNIENGLRIKAELVLKQEDFMMDEDKVVLRSPTPTGHPEPIEQPMTDQFTVDQLMGLFQQFTATAPTGVMSSKSFCETFENIVSVTHGMEQLPDVWMNITPSQIQDISTTLASNTEYVDWRRFLMALTSPVPTPTQAQLLETLVRFKEMDQKDTGFVTREQYDRTDLWFNTEESMTEMTTGSYCRLSNLKKLMFDMFANLDKTPAVLNYTAMLMYFSAVPNSHEGFLRALTVAAGTHMPRLEKPVIPVSTTPANPDRLKNLEEGLPLVTPEIEEKEEKAVEPPMTTEEIPPESLEARVPIEALYKVLHHGDSCHGDSHRFSVSADPEDATSRERLSVVYRELGDEEVEPVHYKILIEHPLIQDIVTACKTFKLLDVKGVLSNPGHDVDFHSIKTMD